MAFPCHSLIPRCLLSLILVVGISSAAESATLVYLLAGQSNMVGYESGLPKTPFDKVQNIKFWKAAEGGWIDLKPGLGETVNDIGPEVGFGHALKASHPNDDIYFVKWAVGSTSLAGPWNSTSSGSEYETFKTRVGAALESLADHSPVIAGLIWMQGESDATDLGSANAYAANLKRFIASVRADFSSSNLPFVLGRITDLSIYPDFPGSAIVRAAQKTVPDEVEAAAWINTDDISMNPNAPGHYSAVGQIELGRRFAEKIQELNREIE